MYAQTATVRLAWALTRAAISCQRENNIKPYLHARLSVKKYGGEIEDYLKIHNFIDSSKAAHPDIRHRAILHSAFGVYIVEQVFGVYFTNSVNKIIQVRDIAEEHIIQDLGFIPTMEKYLENMTVQPWMSGTMKHKKHINFDDLKPDQPTFDLSKTYID